MNEPLNPAQSAETNFAALPGVAWWGALAILCLVLLAPLTLADVPPLLDYPNHFARLTVLAAGGADPALARFYQPHWGIIPNLALDLVVPPLLHVLPMNLVGRGVAGIILLLPVFGAVAYHRALSGRLSYWPLASGLFVYNAAFLRGFLNFIGAIGLALLLAAVWQIWRVRRPRLTVAIGAAGAILLFFCHLTGLLFYGILIGACEVAALRANPRLVFRRAAALALVFLPCALLYFVSSLNRMGGVAEFRSLAEKAHAALFPVINYVWPLDLLTAGFCVLALGLALVRRWCVIPFQAACALVPLVLLFCAAPHGFKGTFDLDTRFIIMAAALLPAALVPIAMSRRAAQWMSMGFVLLFIARIGAIGLVWHNWAGELASFRTVIAPIKPGDVVLTDRLPRAPAPSMWHPDLTGRRLSDGTVVDSHLPALLVIEHRAWWPFLFDNPSQQPIETKEPFRTLAIRVEGARDPIATLMSGAPEMRMVTHVLVLGPQQTVDQIATDGLERLSGDTTAVLFAVRPSMARNKAAPPGGGETSR